MNELTAEQTDISLNEIHVQLFLALYLRRPDTLISLICFQLLNTLGNVLLYANERKDLQILVL
jgi:hypothetical protein